MRRQPVHSVCEGDTYSMNGVPLSQRSFDLLNQLGGIDWWPMGDEFSFNVDWEAHTHAETIAAFYAEQLQPQPIGPAYASTPYGVAP